MSALEKARIFDPDAPKSGFYVQFNPNTLEYAAGLSGQACKGAADRAGQEGAGPVVLLPPPADDFRHLLNGGDGGTVLDGIPLRGKGAQGILPHPAPSVDDNDGFFHHSNRSFFLKWRRTWNRPATAVCHLYTTN